MINATWKTIIAIGTLIFTGCVIVLIIVKGDPANSLHSSALAWSYMTGLGVLAGIGLGEVAPLMASMSRGNT